MEVNYRNPKIYLLSGKARHGKDTIAGYLKEFYEKDGKIRNKLNKAEMFIDRQIDDIEIYSYFYDAIIVPDIRLPREIDSIKEKFDNVVTIKVERINFETNLSGKEQKHSTETAMDSYEDFDYEITNDTLEKLKEDVYKIYQEETK